MRFIKTKRNNITWITILIMTNLLSVFLFTSGLLKLPNTVILTNSSSEFLSQLNKINQLDKLIEQNYTGEIDDSVIGDNLAKALFESLDDPYSEYFTQAEFQEILNSYSGVFGGIGVEIDGSDPENLKITRVLDNTPAQQAGIQAEDIIVKVDGEDVVGQPVDYVVSKTRGDIGTDVVLTVNRGGEEIDFTLTRAEINSVTVYSTVYDDVGYIYIASFGEGTTEQFQKELENLENQNVSGLVIDLRENGGGIVSSAVEVADLLLDQEVIGYAQDKAGDRENFMTKDGKTELPFVVLVDEYTASASELLAGALQKNGITLIGNTTFGKGVIQAMTQLLDGSGYKLTFQEYYLEDGTKVNKTGITPDILVDPSEPSDSELYNGDIQLQRAIENLKSNN